MQIMTVGGAFLKERWGARLSKVTLESARRAKIDGKYVDEIFIEKIL